MRRYPFSRQGSPARERLSDILATPQPARPGPQNLGQPDVPEGAGTEGRVEFLPQSELQAMERRTGRLMDFTVEAGQVTGFKFRDFEAKRVD